MGSKRIRVTSFKSIAKARLDRPQVNKRKKNDDPGFAAFRLCASRVPALPSFNL